MIDKKVIYAELRRRALEFCPQASFTTYKQQTTFQQWLLEGNYTVLSATKGEIKLQASKEDISRLFIIEIENYTNHTYEHLLELFNCQSSKSSRSDAWNVVTGYYFGFFLVQSLLRLLGSPVIYIPSDYLRVAQKLSVGFAGFPKGGTFILSKEADMSVTHSIFSLKQTSRRIHEGSWHQLMQILLSAMTLSKSSGCCDAKELLFYDLITTNKLFKYYVNYEWPSLIRNKCNYNPGQSYKLLIKKQVCKSINIISKLEKLGYQELIDCLDTSVKNCTEDFKSHVDLLFTISCSLFALNRELYLEIMSRRRLDNRWESARKNFLSTNIPKSKNFPFLCVV